jgi:hypothetical protein
MIIVLWLGPTESRRIAQKGQPHLPITICWIASLVAGGIGNYLLYFPELLSQHRLPIIIAWSSLFTTIHIGLIFHVMDTSFLPWVRSLPKE